MGAHDTACNHHRAQTWRPCPASCTLSAAATASPSLWNNSLSGSCTVAADEWHAWHCTSTELDTSICGELAGGEQSKDHLQPSLRPQFQALNNISWHGGTHATTRSQMQKLIIIHQSVGLAENWKEEKKGGKQYALNLINGLQVLGQNE
jgi:hypothetical protein